MTAPAIRVSQYRIGPGEFTGLAHVLKLNRALMRDYFVMISPAADGNSLDARTVGVAVSKDPFGSGGLTATAGLDELELARGNADADWVGTIQVVESERDRLVAGFRLLDVLVTPVTASTAVGVKTDTVAVRVPWLDITRVVPFGGWRGGGWSTAAAGTTKYPSGIARIFPSGTDLITFERFESVGAGDRVDAATIVTYVVEWGSTWTVNRATITGNNFGVGTVVGEWNSVALVGAPLTVTRAETWLWAAGYTQADAPGDTFPGMMLALGDGVTENATESLAAGNWRLDPVGSAVEVWALSHPDAVVDWTSQPAGRGSFATFDQAVAVPVADEGLDPSGPHDPIGITTGRRLAVVTTSSNAGAVAGWPAAVGWHPRHVADAVLNIRRPAPSSPSAWASRIQSVDFGLVLATSEAVAAGSLVTVVEGPTESTTELVYIPNHAELAVGQLIGELQKPRICSLVEALATGVQLLEDLNFALIVDRTLGTAVGANLDQWGDMVNEPRGGLADNDYRRFIAARIAVNESGGSTDELIKIWKLVTAPQISVLEIPLFPAGIHLQVLRETALDDDVARRVGAIMRDAKPSGVSLQLVEAVVGAFGFDTNPDAEPLDVGLFARSL
jgi:hypothetical protein